jgi:hypothetical protein
LKIWREKKEENLKEIKKRERKKRKKMKIDRNVIFQAPEEGKAHAIWFQRRSVQLL